jgi:hypothetical protein
MSQRGREIHGHDVRFVIMSPVVQDTQPPRDDEERRLITDYQACHTEQLAAADQLSNPRHSMLYSAYKQLAETLAAIRLKCDKKWFAVRAYRKKMRDEGK